LSTKKVKLKCWEVFQCKEKECPAYRARNLRCWLFSGTHCRDEIQGKFLEKIELCLDCEVFQANMDVSAMRDSLAVVNRQIKEYRNIVEERDLELEAMSMDLAIGISEVFQALKEISSGNPDIRIPESSTIELISKLKHVVNLTAEEIGEMVNQFHEIAIVLAEQFDVLHKVSKGDLDARVSGKSDVELVEALKKVTNETIESIHKEITERKRAEAALLQAHDELEHRVKKRTSELTIANERLQQEIAERKRIEEALRKSEQKYRTVFENTGNPTLIIDEDATITMVNTKFENFSGYLKEEVEDVKSWIDFFSKNDQDKMKEYHRMKRSDPNGTPSQNEGCFIDRQGNVRDIILNFSVIPGSRKSVITLLDVTERKKLEDKIYQSDKLYSIGTLAAGVAHEINNPLAVILGFTDLLLEKVPAESEIHDILNTIYRQGNNAKRIVENLLSFVRFKEFREEVLDIHKCIEAVLVLEENTFALNNISVNMNMAETLPKVKGDAGELQQVILNIVNNAVGSMKGKGGFLTITTRAINNNQNIEIRISDTGTGIKRENRKKIFDPLFTTKKVGEGTGLGLTVTYAIVKKHGGEITFETKTHEESDNPGTTFIISLPATVFQKNTTI
jgi:PAS domain S-box-containing protein